VTWKEIHDFVLHLAVSLPFPLPEALVGSPLPLPGEIVTADVSLVTMRAPWCRVGEGGGKSRTRGVGNSRTRGVERMVFS